MNARRVMVGSMGVACAALAFAVAPAFGAAETAPRSIKRFVAPRVAGSFTPAAADPKLAALFARSGLDASSFRFTPTESRSGSRSVTVAVRARSTLTPPTETRVAAIAAPTVGPAPIAYNLGVSVGWKRFAVTGDTAKVDLVSVPGGRETSDLALSYAGNRVSGQLRATADRALAGTPALVAERPSYALDLGGSYSLTRNIDLTAGMRYKSERERLTRREDDRHDSQAVYVGTAFRF